MKAEKRYRTTMKVLRETLGWKQDSLATLLGVTRPMVAALEAGKKQPSEKLAGRANFVTNVNADWLLKNDPKIPIKFQIYGEAAARKARREGWIKVVREWAEWAAKRDSQMEEQARFWMEIIFLIDALRSAVAKGQCGLFFFEFSRAVDALRSKFGYDDNYSEELECALNRDTPVGKTYPGGFWTPDWSQPLPIQSLSKAVFAVLPPKDKPK